MSKNRRKLIEELPPYLETIQTVTLIRNKQQDQ